MRLFTLFSLAGLLAAAAPRVSSAAHSVTRGSLIILGKNGPQAECPLKHTDVQADITGYFARVRVTQDFENAAADTVEAVYVFPLPHMAAVDGMTMKVGERTIRGVIKGREEAE